MVMDVGGKRDKEDEESFLDWNGKATLFEDEVDEGDEDNEPEEETDDDWA